MSEIARKFVGGSSFIFLIAILSALVSFIARIVLARNLTLEEFGLFFAVFVFVNFFNLFRNFGLGAALIKYIPEYNVRKEYDHVKSTIIITSSLRILISLFFGFLFIIFSDFLAVYYFKNESAGRILRLLAIFFIVYVISEISKNLFEAFQKPFLYPLVDFSKNVFFLIMTIILLYFGLGIFSPIYSYLFVVIITPLIFLPFIFRLFNFSKHRLILSKELIKKYFLFGAPFLFIGIAGIVIGQIDTLILTYFRSLEEVGVYNVVLPSALLLLQFSSAVSVILFPFTSELWAKGEKMKLNYYANATFKYSLMLVIPLGILIFYFSPYLLGLFFGNEYVIGGNAMRILIIGVIFYTIANLNQYILAGVGKPKITAKIVTIVALFNAILNIILIPKYGIDGAALVTTLSYILGLVLSDMYIKKILNFNINYSSWIKITSFVYNRWSKLVANAKNSSRDLV